MKRIRKTMKLVISESLLSDTSFSSVSDMQGNVYAGGIYGRD